MLNALFLRLGLLVADFRFVEGNFGQNTVQSGHTSILLDLLETFNLGLIYINNYCAVNFVKLVQVANPAFYQLDQDKCLYNGISCRSYSQLIMT